MVSRSTTQKVMSRSGRPSSSKLICADHLLMSLTLGSGTDRIPAGRAGQGTPDGTCRWGVLESCHHLPRSY